MLSQLKSLSFLISDECYNEYCLIRRTILSATNPPAEGKNERERELSKGFKGSLNLFVSNLH